MMRIGDTDALIVVDVQNDFLPGGALPVPAGDAIVPVINRLVPLYCTRVFSRDWHPPDHVSFSDAPTFRDGSWPPHCVQGTPGAGFHPDLVVPDDALLALKGQDPAREAYSSFDAENVDLAGWLREQGTGRVFVVGLATDYCVRATVVDALREGFHTVLVEDAVRGVSPDTAAAALRDMDEAGVERITSADLAAPDARGDG